jgi:hypothetical protein
MPALALTAFARADDRKRPPRAIKRTAKPFDIENSSWSRATR